MNKFEGYIEIKIDKPNDLVITLTCTGNDLIAYTNKYSNFPELLKKKDYTLEGLHPQFNDQLFAEYGNKTNFTEASQHFPFLLDKKYWVKGKWESYDGVPFAELNL